MIHYFMIMSLYMFCLHRYGIRRADSRAKRASDAFILINYRRYTSEY